MGTIIAEPTAAQVLAHIRRDREQDQITRLGLDRFANVTISSTGSWLESDHTGEDD